MFNTSEANLEQIKAVSMLVADLIRTVAIISTATIAVLSYRKATDLWEKNNRPIVSAFVDTESMTESGVVFYNLVVYNSGNRPASNVRLKAEFRDIENCAWDKNNEGLQSIWKCFQDETLIPLLLNGDKKTNYFGLSDGTSGFWKYGESFPIEIDYEDLGGVKYKTNIKLQIKSSKAFADRWWKEDKYKREDVVKLLQRIIDATEK